MTKYHSSKARCASSHVHDSKKEARRCNELTLLQWTMSYTYNDLCNLKDFKAEVEKPLNDLVESFTKAAKNMQQKQEIYKPCSNYESCNYYAICNAVENEPICHCGGNIFKCEYPISMQAEKK